MDAVLELHVGGLLRGGSRGHDTATPRAVHKASTSPTTPYATPPLAKPRHGHTAPPQSRAERGRVYRRTELTVAVAGGWAGWARLPSYSQAGPLRWRRAGWLAVAIRTAVRWSFAPSSPLHSPPIHSSPVPILHPRT